jgi:hypothetical protein
VGLAAAHRLGATYPFEDDRLAVKQFDLYLNYVYGECRNGQQTRLQIFTAWILTPLLWLAIF